MIEFLFRAKRLRRSFVAHLDEVANRKISERVGILFSPGEVFPERALVVLWKFFQAFVQHDTIFERGVHSLAVKRHDRVGGVTDERDLVFVEPRPAADGHE